MYKVYLERIFFFDLIIWYFLLEVIFYEFAFGKIPVLKQGHRWMLLKGSEEHQQQRIENILSWHAKWVICHTYFKYVGKVKAAVRRLAGCHLTVSHQDGNEVVLLLWKITQDAKKSPHKCEHGIELQSSAHS